MQTNNTLCYARLRADQHQLSLEEHELTQGLDLPYRLGDARLRIALAELSGTAEPLSPERITTLPWLHLIWLQRWECLAIPRRAEMSVEEALILTFGPQQVELVADGWLQLHLTGSNKTQLRDASHHSLNGGASLPPLILTDSLSIRPWGRRTQYELLLARSDINALQRQLQNT